MATITISSEQAHVNWQKTLDATSAADTQVVIEQDGKPMATLINHAVFEEMKRKLLILHGLENAEKNRRERLENPSSTTTLTDLAAKLNLADPPAIKYRTRS